MNIKPNTKLPCIAINMENKQVSFTIIVLENHNDHMIVRMKSNTTRLVYDKKSNSMRHQRSGEKRYNHVKFLIMNMAV